MSTEVIENNENLQTSPPKKASDEKHFIVFLI